MLLKNSNWHYLLHFLNSPKIYSTVDPCTFALLSRSVFSKCLSDGLSTQLCWAVFMRDVAHICIYVNVNIKLIESRFIQRWITTRQHRVSFANVFGSFPFKVLQIQTSTFCLDISTLHSYHRFTGYIILKSFCLSTVFSLLKSNFSLASIWYTD